ncbi:MAG: hypothetical protein HZB53_15835 [Chloroflexi bacterium]|nr:hypothetical protein [Chloroflexota bacterium]
MKITRAELINAGYQIGDEIQTGGGRTTFKITDIEVDYVAIQPTVGKTPRRLDYDKLSVAVARFHEIDAKQIDNSLGRMLISAGLKDPTNETYLYGFARNYLARKKASKRASGRA